MRRFLPISMLAIAVFAVMGCPRTPPSAGDAGQRHLVERGPVKFSLGKVDGLQYLIPDSVDWVAAYTVTDSITGPALLLYKPGLETDMKAPHIRLDYVSKQAHMSSNVKDIFDWLKAWYMSDGRSSQVVNEQERITTVDGQEVQLLEIFKPEHLSSTGSSPVKVAAKHVAYAYMDNGNGFWIGTSLSVVGEQSEYDWWMERFRQVVKTYQAGGSR